MKLRIATAFITLLLVASFASADGMQAVLTPDSTRYEIADSPSEELELRRRRGEVRNALVVPTTGDVAIESQARLAYDAVHGTVYVLWHRAAEGIDEIRLASLNARDEWSDALLISEGAQSHRAGLQLTVTHAREEGDTTDTTLVHVAWWNVGAEVVPEYAIVAFDGERLLSTEITNLQTLVAGATLENFAEPEDTGEVAHPPLVMARAGNAVDVVFGRDRSTIITRVRLEPRPISSDARIWRPVGRSTQRTSPAKLTGLASEPVQAFIADDRVVLYTADTKFRYVMLDNGRWTPIRMIELDENLTSEHLVRDLRRGVEENTLLEKKQQ